MRRAFAAVAAFVLLSCSACSSKEYSFAVEKNVSHIHIQDDGAILLDYNITFRNEGMVIDVVDIGFPTENYGSVSADIGGFEFTDIRKSSYIPIGVEIHLKGKSIRKGETATLHVKARVSRMVFGDLVDPAYASIEFSPTWFSPKFVKGRTYLEVNFHFPEGVGPYEVRYHGTEFTSAGVEKGRVHYKWVMVGAMQSQYTFGASFPRRAVSEVSHGIYTPAPAPVTYSQPSGKVRPFAPFIFLAAVAILVIRGCAGHFRRRSYLPPELSIEGIGPNKSLTPAEAAIVLDTPMERVVALVVFGMVRKNAIMILSEEPFTVVEGETAAMILDPTEKAVLEALKSPDSKVRESKLESAMISLVRNVKSKMSGYSREETCFYYRQLVANALKEMETDKEGKCLKWAVLDKDFAERFEGLPEIPQREDWYSPDYMPRNRAYYYRHISGWFGRFPQTHISSPHTFRENVISVTNPAPLSTGSGWRSSGGGCACACAGCACACAGGGR